MAGTEHIRAIIQASISTKEQVLADSRLLATLQAVAEGMADAFRQGNKVLFCGNGGSAADAQHIAAELSGRFYKDRKALFAEALHVNSSYLTAVANDYGYEEVYARMIDGIGQEGDFLVGISTSGNSPNVVKAMALARARGMHTVAMTGQDPGKLARHAEFLLNAPSTDTPRIQETHILFGHIYCQLIEEILFPA